METIEVGKIYKGIVDRIKPTFVVIKFNKNKYGICHISEISDYRVNKIENILKKDKEYNFELIEKNDQLNKYVFSYKKINPKFLKKHYKIISSPSGFEKLKQQTLELLK